MERKWSEELYLAGETEVMMKWDSPSLYCLSADCTLIPFTSMITVPLSNEMENTSDWNASTGFLTREARYPKDGHVFNTYLMGLLKGTPIVWEVCLKNNFYEQQQQNTLLLVLVLPIKSGTFQWKEEFPVFWTENFRWFCHAKYLSSQHQLLS